MKPIGPLMWEHRLIEKMVALAGREARKIEESSRVDPALIDIAVDFIRTYADRTHHGKEEDILFRALAKKKTSPEHSRIVGELIEEHGYARGVTKRLVEAKERYVAGGDTLAEIARCLKELAEFYPRHIEKEDRRFFFPILAYFTSAEQEVMLKEFAEFDRRMIHEKYRQVLESAGGGTVSGPWP
ncbi:MAG: hemerythrin domain-containing protein [Syntrophales bacterium]